MLAHDSILTVAFDKNQLLELNMHETKIFGTIFIFIQILVTKSVHVPNIWSQNCNSPKAVFIYQIRLCFWPYILGQECSANLVALIKIPCFNDANKLAEKRKIKVNHQSFARAQPIKFCFVLLGENLDWIKIIK